MALDLFSGLEEDEHMKLLSLSSCLYLSSTEGWDD